MTAGDQPGEELVAAEARVVEPARPAGQVAVQAAAVATTSFVVGAGLAAVMRGRKGRRAARRFSRGRRDVNVVATRSFLVDVHLIDPRK
jgi:hypothetical protein